MLAKQGDSRNKVNIKRLTLYALFVAVCLIVGYLENMLSMTIVAGVPGAKLGISNALVLMLFYNGDKKGAWAVNVIRIVLSALLFGSPISFLFSLSGGIASLLVTHFLVRLKSVSAIGVGAASAVVHNVFQLIAATLFMGVGIVYYLPVLIVFGTACGALCGIFTQIVITKTKNKNILKF